MSTPCYRCSSSPCMCSDGITLLQGDFLEWAPMQPAGRFDLVFGSPPYEDTRLYNMDFKLKGQDWVDWMVEVVQQSLRICKGLVAFVVEGRTRQFRWSATPVLLMADLHRAGVHLRKPPIFHRVGIPGNGGPDWLRNDYEFIVCATNGGKLAWSDNTAMGHPPKWAPGGEMSYRLTDGTRRNQWGHSGTGKSGARKKDGTHQNAARPSHRFQKVAESERTIIKKFPAAKRCPTKSRADGEMEEQAYIPPAIANPGNVIQQMYTADEVVALLQYASDVTHHRVGGGQMGDPLAHENEAPFPEPLAEFFVKSFCPPSGLVLDPFSGSGTTMAVCKEHGRGGVGLDVRESQAELATRRLSGERPKPVTQPTGQLGLFD